MQVQLKWAQTNGSLRLVVIHYFSQGHVVVVSEWIAAFRRALPRFCPAIHCIGNVPLTLIVTLAALALLLLLFEVPYLVRLLLLIQIRAHHLLVELHLFFVDAQFGRCRYLLIILRVVPPLLILVFRNLRWRSLLYRA